MESEQEPSRQGGTILVVDDHDPVRDVVLAMLERNGYRVVGVSDGDSALELFRSQSGVVCAIIDWTMPGMSGEQVAIGLRDIDPQLKVIMMSAYPNEVIRARLGGIEIDAFLQKPFMIESLLEIIADVLGD